MRTVALGEQPHRLIENYEDALRGCGFSDHEIEAFAAVLMDVIRGLMRGMLRGEPQFECIDKGRPGYSCYVFADDIVAGFYSASPHHVFLQRLVFTFENDVDTAIVASQMKAEARMLAAA